MADSTTKLCLVSVVLLLRLVSSSFDLQGHYGFCWAFGAVESLTDRFCIQFGMNITLSVNDPLACCGFRCGDGCDGGYPIAAWQYFSYSGVVREECDPYFDNTRCSHLTLVVNRRILHRYIRGNALAETSYGPWLRFIIMDLLKSLSQFMRSCC